MANRDNPYEAAFEEYLRARGVPYVAVDEARRSVLAEGGSLKSLDFIVSTPGPVTWLVDVKGRRFPSGDDHQRHYWKNWSTRDDLDSLARWESLFGATFRGLFVFAYVLLSDRSPLPQEQLFEHRGALYGFVAVTLADYAARCHLISPRWQTVAMGTDAFRRLARPVASFLADATDVPPPAGAILAAASSEPPAVPSAPSSAGQTDGDNDSDFDRWWGTDETGELPDGFDEPF